VASLQRAAGRGWGVSGPPALLWPAESAAAAPAAALGPAQLPPQQPLLARRARLALLGADAGAAAGAALALRPRGWALPPVEARAWADLDPWTKGFLAGLALLALANTLCTLARAFTFAVAGMSAARRTHDRLLRAVMLAPVAFFDRHSCGRILNRCARGRAEAARARGRGAGTRPAAPAGRALMTPSGLRSLHPAAPRHSAAPAHIRPLD
jgi:hypothetical protein